LDENLPMQRLGCVSLLLAAALAITLVNLFAGALETGLLKLGLARPTASLVVIGILLGSIVNIPIWRVTSTRPVSSDPLALVGLGGFWGGLRQVRHDTVIAVNLGGCVIPSGLAAYEAWLLLRDGGPIPGAAVVILAAVAACYWLARPIAGVGIVLPGLIPALVAAGAAELIVPGHATPVAFMAGTFGPLVGADLFHLRQIARTDAALLSIGGAGTFDGIVLSGVVALYLS
jgi:uncharacterized membrane protein